MTSPRLSGPLFDRVSGVPLLTEAWEKVAANAGAAGGDGVTVARFGSVAAAQIDRLSRLLRAGQYRAGPARRVYVPKAAPPPRPGLAAAPARLRQLDIPCVADRVVQAAAAMALDPVLDPVMEPVSYAYRKGRSVAQAVARVAALRRAGFTHVLDADIEDCFGSIPHEPLIARLEQHLAAQGLADDALVDLVWMWLETYSLTGRGVAQGSPLSPLLANLYLDEMDGRIGEAGLKLVRFADDFLVLARTRAAIEGGLSLVREVLAREGLTLNEGKSRLVTFEEGFRFLGHIFVRGVTMQAVDDGDATPDEEAIAAAETAARLADEQAAEPFPEFTGEAGEDADGRAAGLRPIYLVEPGRRLEVFNGRLTVADANGRLLDIPPAAFDRIEIGPDCDATLEAMDMAAAHGCDIFRVDGAGAVLGRWLPAGPQRAALHMAQAALALDAARRDSVARALVAARIHGQRAVLRRLNRARADGQVAQAAARLSRVIRKLTLPLSRDEARGVEGEAAALYWPALARCLPPGLSDGRRRRRPAAGPFDAALNAAMSLLARDVLAMLERAGLHPGLGLLHVPEDGDEALAHDLMEEFRAPLGEAFVAACFNRQALRAEHARPQGEGFHLTREGWRALLRGYEAWVARPVKAPDGRMMLWRSLMLAQARAFARAALEGGDYAPYRMDY